MESRCLCLPRGWWDVRGGGGWLNRICRDQKIAPKTPTTTGCNSSSLLLRSTFSPWVSSLEPGSSTGTSGVIQDPSGPSPKSERQKPYHYLGGYDVEVGNIRDGHEKRDVGTLHPRWRVRVSTEHPSTTLNLLFCVHLPNRTSGHGPLDTVHVRRGLRVKCLPL